ncbi:GL20556 [Drosophila persimilis]|uniref:GL20556 n=1 Tax=Drosophila persimilis TaxID=7234 RepID=B4IR84_DROPE|nr:GL20556 [Drosophila persimilis]
MQEICRVCMTNSGPFTNIFDERPTLETCIADMITQCTGYVVRRGDLLPENICPPCLEDAVSAFTLKKTCEHSHKLYFPVMVEDIEEFADTLDDEDWEPSDIESEQSKHFENDEEMNQNDSNNIDQFVRPFKCSDCTKSFHQKAHLQSHTRTHTGDRPYQCSYCSMSFAQKYNLDRHTRSHTNDLSYQCPHCSKSFIQKCNLEKHTRTHTGDRPYQCSHCSKSFPQKSHLHVHNCTHAMELPHMCPHCSKSFSRSDSLRIHILRLHTDKRPYKCSHCSQSFQQKFHLREHSRIHTGERPHRCSYCSKSFKQKSKLDRHTLTHTGERPYQCTQCSKSFQEKSNLQVHLRSHKCIHCSKTFRYRNSSYQRHILTHKSNDNCAIPSFFEITSVRTLRMEDSIAPTAPTLDRNYSKHDFYDLNKLCMYVDQRSA